MKVLTLKPRVKKNGNIYRINLYKPAPDGRYLTREEIKEYLQTGYELNLVIDNKGLNADKTVVREDDILMRIITDLEPLEGNDVDFLNRIIRNGGLISYAKQLEMR